MVFEMESLKEFLKASATDFEMESLKVSETDFEMVT